MNATLPAALLLVALVAATSASGRSSSVRAEFVHRNPCPATGHTRGPCPGYVVDHIVPLCVGGADEPANLQWQTVAAGKAKDREELALCRARREI